MPKFFSDRLNFDAAVFHPTYRTTGRPCSSSRSHGCASEPVRARHAPWPGDRRSELSARLGARRARRGRAAERAAAAGIGPYRLALRRLRRNKAALAFGGAVPADRRAVPAARRSTRRTSRTPAPNANHVTDRSRSAARPKDVVSADGHADRADLAGRASSSAPTRTAATSRCGCSTAGATRCEIGFVATLITMILATILGARRRLLPRLRRRRALARPRPHLGLSGRAARHRARHVARARRHQARAASSSRATRCCVPAFIIGIVYIPYVAKPIRGQVLGAAREGVRRRRARRRARARCGSCATRDPAQPLLDDHRLHPADHRQRDPARGGAVLPRRRRAAAEPVVGDDDLRRHPR